MIDISNYVSGSVLLFEGKGLVSNIIKAGQIRAGLPWKYSKISHCGLLCWVNDKPYIFESTTLNTVPDIRGSYKKGPQIVSYQDRVSTYKGSISIRSFSGDEDLEERVAYTISEVYKEFFDKPYEQNMYELISAALDFWPFKNKRDLGSIFCSEQNAEVYIRAGLLFKKKPSNEYTPADFCTLKPIQGVLGEMEKIK